MAHRLANRDNFDVVDHLGDEGFRQQAACGILSDPPRAKVEKCLFVEFAYGCPMAALNVVRLDSKLWFRIGLRLIRKQ